MTERNLSFQITVSNFNSWKIKTPEVTQNSAKGSLDAGDKISMGVIVTGHKDRRIWGARGNSMFFLQAKAEAIHRKTCTSILYLRDGRLFSCVKISFTSIFRTY